MLTKKNPDEVFAFRWRELLTDLKEGLFSPEVLKRVLTESEYKMLVELAKKVTNG
jgi:hypothetical protein